MNKTKKFIEHINEHILPFIDYNRLQQSYETDMEYAKGVLNKLHIAMIEVYETEYFDRDFEGSDDGIIVVPGVALGKESEELRIGFFDIDLESSGEHWGTDFLCKYGVVYQCDATENRAEVLEEINAMTPYDYTYTATIPHDIHIDKSKLPKEIQSILNDFHNHSIDLLGCEEEAETEDFGDDCCQ
jgi:hypothetical protein